MNMEKTFDDAFPKAWRKDLTREPADIQRDIAKQEGIQAGAIRDALEMTRDARRRMPRSCVGAESNENRCCSSTMLL